MQQQGFFEIAKVVKPVKAGLNPEWEIWLQVEEVEKRGETVKVPKLIATIPPDRLPPHVRKALNYETRGHFHYGKDFDKHVFGQQVKNHRW